MIRSLILRRYWIIKNRLLSTVGFLFLLPIFSYLVINLPLKRMVVNPLWDVPHEQWILPGLVIIVIFIMMIPIIYRDLFELRIHNQLIPSLALTPVSKQIFLYNFLFTVILETALYSVVTMAILTALMVPNFGLLNYLEFFPFIILFGILGANILITLSLIVDKTTQYNVLNLSFIIFILFGSGLIIDFDFYPQIIGDVLRYLPTGQIMLTLRMALFSDVYNWPIIGLTFATVFIWTYLNGVLFNKRSLK